MHTFRVLALFLLQFASLALSGERTITIDDSEVVTLAELKHWGGYARAAYDNFEQWDEACESCQASEAMRATRVNVTWSMSLPAFSRGFIGVNSQRGEAVVSFRGTTHVMDVLTDSQMAQVSWPDAESHVHMGFLLAYMSARSAVQAGLRLLLAEPEYTVVFVGHSLGAAQAVLAYADFCLVASRELCGRARLVTFGAPRVGNSHFARLVGDHGSPGIRALRVVHGSDIVAQLPRSLPLLHGQYVHSDREVWIRDDALTLCGAGEDPQCSASTHVWQWNMLDHMEYPGISLLF
ncbi:hypothetical protein GGI20_004325 [Coemansia sp. BCRC 34301]|nr:hypothetical protein GGI20_004325 [Coemansia sp. BCRC 34301]